MKSSFNLDKYIKKSIENGKKAYRIAKAKRLKRIEANKKTIRLIKCGQIEITKEQRDEKIKNDLRMRFTYPGTIYLQDANGNVLDKNQTTDVFKNAVVNAIHGQGQQYYTQIDSYMEKERYLPIEISYDQEEGKFNLIIQDSKVPIPLNNTFNTIIANQASIPHHIQHPPRQQQERAPGDPAIDEEIQNPHDGNSLERAITLAGYLTRELFAGGVLSRYVFSNNQMDRPNQNLSPGRFEYFSNFLGEQNFDPEIHAAREEELQVLWNHTAFGFHDPRKNFHTLVYSDSSANDTWILEGLRYFTSRLILDKEFQKHGFVNAANFKIFITKRIDTQNLCKMLGIDEAYDDIVTACQIESARKNRHFNIIEHPFINKYQMIKDHVIDDNINTRFRDIKIENINNDNDHEKIAYLTEAFINGYRGNVQ